MGICIIIQVIDVQCTMLLSLNAVAALDSLKLVNFDFESRHVNSRPN